MNTKLIGQYLMEEHQITERQIQEALAIQANNLKGGNTPLIGTILVSLGAVDEQDVTRALKKQQNDRQAT